MRDVLQESAFWIATSIPFIVTLTTVLITRSTSPIIRTLCVGTAYFASLPLGLVLVLLALDHEPEMRRATDGLAAIPMMVVWVMTALIIGGALWLNTTLNERSNTDT